MTGVSRRGLERRNSCAHIVRDRDGFEVSPIDHYEDDLATNAIHAIGTAERNIQSQGTGANFADGQRGREILAENAGRHKVDFEVDGRQAPSAGGNDVGEGKVQRVAIPVLYEAVEHFQITRIEDDTSGVAVPEAHKYLFAKWNRSGIRRLSHVWVPLPERA